MSKGFIRYETKNGVEYASVYKARREGGKKVNDTEYLGRVIDKEKGIFRNRARGTFHFSFESGVVETSPPKMEKLILDFGDGFFLGEMLKRMELLDLVGRVFGKRADCIASLLFYKVLCGGANRHALSWWEGSYARILFPGARLLSQRISETLSAVGNERVCRAFFTEYLRFI